ncbi:hypothetical protein THAOC_28895, partial [Thalassiosira oceanica]
MKFQLCVAVIALTQSVLVTSSGGLRVKGSDKLEVDDGE